MLTIRSTGSIANLVQSMREVHGRLVPYAAATALTRTARGGALSDVAEEMMRVFHNPRPYTLNSLFVQPASKDDLSARLMVKNQAAGTKPEHGSSPRTRGTEVCVAHQHPLARFIPAHAGTRAAPHAPMARYMVHPRARGEQAPDSYPL